jgi:hypothetical protein
MDGGMEKNRFQWARSLGLSFTADGGMDRAIQAVHVCISEVAFANLGYDSLVVIGTVFSKTADRVLKPLATHDYSSGTSRMRPMAQGTHKRMNHHG